MISSRDAVRRDRLTKRFIVAKVMLGNSKTLQEPNVLFMRLVHCGHA
jgi:hypothetical protein